MHHKNRSSNQQPNFCEVTYTYFHTSPINDWMKYYQLCQQPSRYENELPWLQGSWGQHGAHLGPIGPRWAPCWHHEPCYLGSHQQWMVIDNHWCCRVHHNIYYTSTVMRTIHDMSCFFVLARLFNAFPPRLLPIDKLINVATLRGE